MNPERVPENRRGLKSGAERARAAAARRKAAAAQQQQQAIRRWLGLPGLSDDCLEITAAFLHAAASAAKERPEGGEAMAAVIGRLGAFVLWEGDARGLSGPTPTDLREVLDGIERVSK